MSEPVLIAVDDDPDALKDVERELRDRYGRHYRVTALASSGAALTLLEDLAEGDQDVALILAGQRLTATSGTELLGRKARGVRGR
jgi:thioredoxin reductase (NADPH)